MARVFFAVSLPDEARRTIDRATEALRTLAPRRKLRFTHPDGFHVTLKFLGELDDEALAEVTEGAQIVSRPTAPLPSEWTALTAFPNPRRARVLVAGLTDPDRRLAGLAEELDALAEAVGVPREQRPFRPHVTLARLKPPDDVADLCSAVPLAGSFSTTELVLYESVRGPQGMRYEALRRFPFG